MSSPYPPSAPRKLYRSRSKRMIGGVCGGLADHLNMDPTLVRILTVVISLFTGIPVVLYIVALFVVPEEPADLPPQGYPPVNGPQGYNNPYAAPAPGAPYGGAAYGQPPVQPEAEVWGTAGAPWEQSSATNMAPGPVPSPEPAPQAEPAPPTEPGPPAEPAEPAPPAEPPAPVEPEPSAQPEPDPVMPAHEADAEETFDEPDHPVAPNEDQPKS